MKPNPLVLAAALALIASTAHARLGETEEQSFKRYGVPVAPEGGPPGPRRESVAGTKEISYEYEGCRIRASFLNKICVRIEYKRPGGEMSEKQADAILDAEKGNSHWKIIKEERHGPPPPSGRKDRDKSWTRGDKSTAKLEDFDSKLVFQLGLVSEKEKKDQGVVPKF